jgi:hypothetical protein
MRFSPDGHQIFGPTLEAKGRDRGPWRYGFDGYGHVYQNGTTDSKNKHCNDGIFPGRPSLQSSMFSFAQWTEDGHLIGALIMAVKATIVHVI